MNVLTPVPLRSAAALAAVVAESLESVEAGGAVLARGFVAGETVVDLLAVDAERRPVAIVTELEADTAAVVRAIEAAAWCRETPGLLARAFPDASLDTTGPVRVVLVAGHLSDRALRLLRALGPQAPEALECRVFELNGERCVSYEAVGERGARTAERGARSRPAEGAPVSREAVAAPRETGDDEAAERARRLIERLETLTFRGAFPS